VRCWCGICQLCISQHVGFAEQAISGYDMHVLQSHTRTRRQSQHRLTAGCTQTASSWRRTADSRSRLLCCMAAAGIAVSSTPRLNHVTSKVSSTAI
jgi:hypothetical protein